MTLPDNALIDVEAAEYVGEYKIIVYFSNNMERVVDFEPFLSRSLNPLISRYRDKNLFKEFRVKYGDLVWGDYDLCFPVVDLYEDRIG